MKRQPSESDNFATAPVRHGSLLPLSAELIAAFAGGDGGSDHAILGLGGVLAANHQRQWEAEDACRRPGADLGAIGEAKRRIDALNAKRVAVVERIDEVVESRLRHPESVPLHTETLGSVIDRLAIAWIRANSLSRASENRDRARAALRQLGELAAAYDDLVRDLARERRRLPGWRTLKSYGSTA